MSKPTRGGTRKGAGAKHKYGEPTETISFRCPVSKVEEIESQVLKFQQRLSTLNKLRIALTRLHTYYYQQNNVKMMAVIDERKSRVLSAIQQTSIELKPYNDASRAEYEKSDVHKFLKGSSGMNGTEILIQAIKQ